MKYGYARVSTSTQGRDGNSLEAQDRSLRDSGAQMVLSDTFTGTKRHRPELDKLMGMLQPGDTLLVTRLDRIARSVVQGAEIITELLDRNVAVHVLNIGMMDNSSTGKLMRNIFFAFAEFERDMIVERTSEGKAIARQHPGYREGRPKKPVDDFEKILQKQKSGEITTREAYEQLGISKRTWYRLVNAS